MIPWSRSPPRRCRAAGASRQWGRRDFRGRGRWFSERPRLPSVRWGSAACGRFTLRSRCPSRARLGSAGWRAIRCSTNCLPGWRRTSPPYRRRGTRRGWNAWPCACPMSWTGHLRRRATRCGVGVGVLLPPVLGGGGPPLPPPGRPHRTPGAGSVGHPGAGLSIGELPGPHLDAARILRPDAVLVVSHGGALRVPGPDVAHSGLLWHCAPPGGVYPGGGHPRYPVGAGGRGGVVSLLSY